MKKILMYALTVLLLSVGFTACSNKSTYNQSADNKKQTDTSSQSSGQTQEELNNEIKSKAVKADFVKINGGEWDGKEVYIEGEITSEPNPEDVLPQMTVSLKEGSNYNIYSITVIDKNNIDKLKKKANVKVYGKVSGKNDLGMPSISGNIIENK